MNGTNMRFIFDGFSERSGFRIFAFEGVAEDRSRSPFTVRTGLLLARQYGVPLQELPLLCRQVLERGHDGLGAPEFEYTEDDMCLYAIRAAARAVASRKKKKPPLKPPQGEGISRGADERT